MKISDFIKELSQKGVEISFSGGNLIYSSPVENMTPELIENLKKYKGKLMKYFWPKEYKNMFPINAEGNKIPLFLVHSIFGNYTIRDYFGPDQPIYGFFHSGNKGEKIVYKNIEEMAKEYLNQILSLRPLGPYYLSGFSLGGLLVFELAAQLQKLGHEVPFLVIIDTKCPLASEPVKLHSNFFKLIKSNIVSPVKRNITLHLKLSICKQVCPK